MIKLGVSLYPEQETAEQIENYLAGEKVIR